MTEKNGDDAEKKGGFGGRPKGSKNIPLTTAELQARLKEVYASQGVDIGFSFVSQTEKNEDGSPKVAEDKPSTLEDIFKLSTDDVDDTEGFECGACSAELDQEYPVCPKCGARLTW